jgi:hypothetical protein
MFLDNRIAGSWDALTIRLHEQSALDRWRQVEPVLAGVTDLEDLRRQLRPGTPRKRADELLGALVRLSAVDGHDDGDAVLLLHLLSEGAEVLAGRLADQTGDVLALGRGGADGADQVVSVAPANSRVRRELAAGHEGSAVAGAEAASDPNLPGRR